MARKPTTLERILMLHSLYHKLLPGKESLIRLLNEAEVSEHVYNSNAIENSRFLPTMSG